jgi:hypothetical protein
MADVIFNPDPVIGERDAPLPEPEELAWADYLLFTAKSKVFDIVEDLERGFDWREQKLEDGSIEIRPRRSFRPIALEEYGRLMLLAQEVRNQATELGELAGKLEHVAYNLYHEHDNRKGRMVADVSGVVPYKKHWAMVTRGFEREAAKRRSG